MFLLVKFFRSLELSPEHALIVQSPHGNGSPSHEIRKLPHVLIRCDHTPSATMVSPFSQLAVSAGFKSGLMESDTTS